MEVIIRFMYLLLLFAVYSEGGNTSFKIHDCPRVEVMKSFDMEKFLGVWYVQQRYSPLSSCIKMVVEKTDGDDYKITESAVPLGLDIRAKDEQYSAECYSLRWAITDTHGMNFPSEESQQMFLSGEKTQQMYAVKSNESYNMIYCDSYTKQMRITTDQDATCVPYFTRQVKNEKEPAHVYHNSFMNNAPDRRIVPPLRTSRKISFPSKESESVFKVSHGFLSIIPTTYGVVSTDYANYAALWGCDPYLLGSVQNVNIITREQVPNEDYIKEAKASLEKFEIDLSLIRTVDQSHCNSSNKRNSTESSEYNNMVFA